MRLLLASLLLASGVAASAQPLQRAERVPRIGIAGHDLDACLSIGQVSGLNPQGDNFLTVRALPSTDGAEKDRLGPGRWLWLCDKAGDWLGVVSCPEPVEPGECGVGSPFET
jgi:hypothetical protein